jgi:hypothetical protein
MTMAPASQTMHLTEDQLDDHLIGDLAAAPAAHLAACAHCSARVAEAADPLNSFRAVSLAWGERQSATSPIPSVAGLGPAWERRLVWSLILAACAVGLGLANATHRAPSPSTAATTAVAVQPVSPSADQLSNDNQLLNTIDSELSASSETPAALGLVSMNATRTSSARAKQVLTSVQD